MFIMDVLKHNVITHVLVVLSPFVAYGYLIMGRHGRYIWRKTRVDF